MKRLLKNAQVKYLLSFLGVDILFFGITNPYKISLGLLMIGIALVSLTVYLSLNIYTRLLFPNSKSRHALVVIFSIVISFLMAMQSIGQLTSRDALAVIPLGLVLYVYVYYFSKR